MCCRCLDNFPSLKATMELCSTHLAIRSLITHPIGPIGQANPTGQRKATTHIVLIVHSSRLNNKNQHQINK